MSDFLADEDGFISLSNEQKNAKKQFLIALDRSLNAIQKLMSFNLIFSDTQTISEKKSIGMQL